MKAVLPMFSFSRCIGRRQKSGPQQPDQLDQKRSSLNAFGAPEPGSDHTDSTKVTSEIEPKKLDNFECTIGTPISLKSTGKKSYCSSMISRSSASFSQFCSGFSSVEPTQTVNDCRLSIDLGWPSPQAKLTTSSRGLNLQIKCTEFSLDRSLTIREEGEGPPSARPHSYSDDPFAPPTPRVAKCTPSYTSDSIADSDTIRTSALVAQAHQIDVKEASDDPAILIPLVQPQVELPTIARISKLSFGDWVFESPKESPVPLSRSRLLSKTRCSTLASPVPTYRTPMSTNAMNSPRTPHFDSSRAVGTNQVPFPEYP